MANSTRFPRGLVCARSSYLLAAGEDMLSYNDHGIVGSFLEPVPILTTIEAKFNSNRASQWLNDNLPVPVVASLTYIIMLYLGMKWMKDREPYKLKTSLLAWNICLAFFSMLGALSLIPNLVHGIYKEGLYYSVCVSDSTVDPRIGLWGFVFVISKLFEFLDTAFLVLRKKPVKFLHWYHHTTVLIYSWYILGTWSTATGLWFSAINYAVHSIMYTYYSLKAASLYVPSKIALFITVLQLVQMFIGLFVNGYVYYQSIVLQRECNANQKSIYLGLVVYGSYAVLFMHFFFSRYIWKRSKKLE